MSTSPTPSTLPQASEPPAAPACLPALTGVRILSLSLNLPGPAALQRCRRMGASCVKIEPPSTEPGLTGDPMSRYSPAAYAALNEGINILVVDLKKPLGQASLHRELAHTQVLLTSFRPGALHKLGLDVTSLRQRYPRLGVVSLVGYPGERADEAGHDLTYMAENDLITGLDMPATLLADMSGALAAAEAVLQIVLLQARTGRSHHLEVALSDAAAHLALPRRWGAMGNDTLLGGGHAGYRIYPCADGRVALAALEPHFAQRLCALLGLPWHGLDTMFTPQARQAVAYWLAGQNRQALEALALAHDLPLRTLPA